MKERILQIIKEEELTNAKFANEIGVQPSSISHIVSGRNKASIDLITKILHRYPRISSDWLVRGKGEMYVSDNSHNNTPGTYNTTQADLFSQPEQESKGEENPEISDPEDNLGEEQTSTSRIHEVTAKAPELKSIRGSSDKKIEKIVVFYSDKTFSEYNPE